MAHPPYQAPVYLQTDISTHVAEAKSDTAYSELITAARADGEPLQVWWLDPFSLDENKFFVHLNSNRSLVLESPKNNGGKCYLNTQLAGANQQWVLSDIGDNMWRLKNVATNFDMFAFDSDAEIIAYDYSAALPPRNVNWKIIVKQK